MSMGYIDEVLHSTGLERPEYIDDTKRIIKVALDNGVLLTLEQAEKVWLKYSDDMAAGWMGMPESDLELWQLIK